MGPGPGLGWDGMGWDVMGWTDGCGAVSAGRVALAAGKECNGDQEQMLLCGGLMLILSVQNEVEFVRFTFQNSPHH